MADRSLADYIMEQLAGLDGVRRRPMMGGWLFYYRSRLFGGIYANGFLVKLTPAAQRHMPDSVPEPCNGPGGAPMLPVTILDDAEALCAMVADMWPELPDPVPRRRKRKSR